MTNCLITLQVKKINAHDQPFNQITGKATEILFLVLRILFFKNRVGGRNKIKNKIFLQVPIHMEYWMSEILHSIYNMMGFRRNQTSFQQRYFSYYVR